jgi:hypothetical protein
LLDCRQRACLCVSSKPLLLGFCARPVVQPDLFAAWRGPEYCPTSRVCERQRSQSILSEDNFFFFRQACRVSGWDESRWELRCPFRSVKLFAELTGRTVERADLNLLFGLMQMQTGRVGGAPPAHLVEVLLAPSRVADCEIQVHFVIHFRFSKTGRGVPSSFLFGGPSFRVRIRRSFSKQRVETQSWDVQASILKHRLRVCAFSLRTVEVVCSEETFSCKKDHVHRVARAPCRKG